LEKLNILHVTPSYIPAWRYGGPIWSVHGLAKAQATLGHRVRVFTTSMDGPNNLDIPLKVAVDREGVEVFYYPVGSLLGPLARRIFFAPEMAKAIRNVLPSTDVVHTHSAFLWPTMIAGKKARRANVRTVYTPRGMLWPEMVLGKSQVAKRAWIAAFEKSNVEKSSAVHVTASLEEEKIRELGLSPQRVINLPNAVEVPSEIVELPDNSVLSSLSDHKNYILSFGRIHEKKNNEALIDALENRPELRAVIAGVDDDGYAVQLQQRIQSKGLTSQIKVLPRQISGPEKEFLFQQARLFILPSHSENFGNTVLEAMVRGIPVIASNQTGAASVVKDAEAGFICTPDARSVGDTWDLAMSEHEKLTAMGRSGQAFVETHYTWPIIASKMVSAYQELAIR